MENGNDYTEPPAGTRAKIGIAQAVFNHGFHRRPGFEPRHSNRLAPEATEEAEIAFDSCSVLSAAACKSGRRIEIPVRITARSDRAPNLWLQNREAWPAVRFWPIHISAEQAEAAVLLIS